jgi:uncharacterized protein (DUF58 family)
MQEGGTGLTRKGWAVLLLAGALFASGVLFGIQELYPIGAAVLVSVVAARAWVGAQTWDLRVARHVHPARVPEGGEAKVELTVVNHSSRRSPVVAASDPFDGGRRWARFSIAPLDPGGTRMASYRLPTSARGIYRLGPLELEMTDPFGMARVVRSATPDASLTVHPKVDHISSRTVSTHDDRDLHLPLPVVGQGGDEFYGLREYQPGDDSRMIHWPSTARVDNLVIRQAESLWQGRATVAIDLRSAAHDQETLEPILSAGASLAAAALRAGLHVRVVTTGGLDTGYGNSTAHGAAILDSLAGAATHEGASFTEGLRVIRTSDPLTVITTDATADSDLGSACRLGGMRKATAVVFERRIPRDGYRIPANSRYLRIRPGVSFRTAWEGLPC